MAPWVHQILFDTSLNSIRTAYGNLYCIALLSAAKAYAHISSLPNVGCCRENISFLVEAIKSSAVYLGKLVLRRIGGRKNSTLTTQSSGNFLIKTNFVVWLGLNAYLSVMKFKGCFEQVRSGLLTEMMRSRHGEARRALASLTHLIDDWALPRFVW
jgi:hypothetical protein